MTKILIIDDDYPVAENSGGDVFVHVRAKAYSASCSCLILAAGQYLDCNIEGISVARREGLDERVRAISDYRPDIVFVHFLMKWHVDTLLPLIQCPVVVWVHGYEALKWTRRLYNFNWRYFLSLQCLKLNRNNRKQLTAVGSIMKRANATGDFHFVFVSDWMRKIAEKDCGATCQAFSIIPNPIDTEFFAYREKPPEFACKVLVVRSFHSRKYATDLACSAISKICQSEDGDKFEFTIAGEGKHFEEDIAPLRGRKNVKIINSFLSHSEVLKLHQEHGVFLCPTRQDAQGVSMCEAMSSGLVPISNPNTAIPEFVADGESGLLVPETVSALVGAMQRLAAAPDHFSEISRQASQAMHSCSLQSIIDRELLLGQTMINRSASSRRAQIPCNAG